MAKVGTRAALLFGCLLAIGAGCSVSRGIPGGSPTTAGVERVILDQTPNPSDPGQILELTRVTIGPGTCIPPHTHPGPQLGTLVAGTLSYRIIDGEVALIFNTTEGWQSLKDSQSIRGSALTGKVPYFTTAAASVAAAEAIAALRGAKLEVRSLQDYYA